MAYIHNLSVSMHPDVPVRQTTAHRADTRACASDEHGLADETGSVEDRHFARCDGVPKDLSMYREQPRKEGEPCDDWEVLSISRGAHVPLSFVDESSSCVSPCIILPSSIRGLSTRLRSLAQR